MRTITSPRSNFCAGLERPDLAPAVLVHELACENIAGTPLITFFADQLNAVMAFAACLVLWVLAGIDLSGVVHVAHRHSHRIFFVEMRRGALGSCFTDQAGCG